MAVAHVGAISFGLVHIPVSLYRTTKDNDISFNQLCKQTKQRIQYKKFCPSCDKEIKNSDIVKGYQYEKDKYVIMTQEEIERIKTEKDRTINILQFTDLQNVDDLYYEKNYYAIPEVGGEKAYELLREAMYNTDKTAIAKTILGTKETLLALCATDEYILIKTLFFHDEIVELPKTFKHPKLNKSELTMAKQLIQSMASPFQPSMYHDEYQERLMQAIEAKINGNDIVSAHVEESNNITNLMDALKESVALQKKSTPRKKAVRH